MLYLIIALLGAFVIYSFLIEPRWVQVTRLEVYLKRLPPAFDGFKILHLTDLHTQRWGWRERFVTDWVARQSADIVAVTGDVMVYPFQGADVTRLMVSLNHRLPVWFVLGNHDVRENPHLPDLLQEWRAQGIRILRNSHERLERNGAAIYLIGVDDPHLWMDDLKKALRGVPADACKILLAHSADIWEEAVRSGVDLILSGHTHGGQVRLPLLGALIANTRKIPRAYAAGLFDLTDHTQLFVNRGLGHSTLPLRFLCRPQVAIVTLRKEKPGTGKSGRRPAAS
ncbi:MAG: metallophosphoesterase [Abditibacteriales bacterium]|nr:metallophosphoesterase [Abditibacteriales bacterium]